MSESGRATYDERPAPGIEPDFQRVLEAAPDLYLILSPGLRVVGATDAYLRATMTAREVIVGRDLFDVFPDNPDDRDATGVSNLHASLNRVRATLAPDTMALQRYDIRRPASQGGGFEVRYWLPNNWPILDAQGSLCYILHRVQDVTETELGRLRHEARLQHVLESAPVGMVVLDGDGRIAFANLAVLNLFGHPEDALLGQPAAMLTPDAYRGECAARLQSARGATTSAPAFWDEPGMRRDGSSFPAEWRLVALEADTLLLSVLDLSPRVAAEEAARHAQGVAERASLSKNAFLARMSHELRTPLNAVLGFAQLLEMDGGLTAEGTESVAQILRGGRHLLQLVNEVIDISRIESGRLSLSPEPFVASEAAGEAVNLIRPLAAQHGVEVTLVPLEADLSIHADRQRFRQVLLNLLTNGVKYNRRGGSVRVDWARPADGVLRVNVHDTGAGIAPGQLELLFQPFERLGAEQTAIEGTGLGLAVSRALVEAMGGTIGVETVVGQGSTFWVDLLLASGQATSALANPASLPTVDLPQQAGLVLYVEDNLANVRLMERVLRHRPGVRLSHAPDGQTGLRLVSEERPTLVLLDLHLPDTSGEDVLRQIRADAAHQSIPVVILTADATPGLARRLKALGAHELLTKPIDIGEVIALVDRLTGRAVEGGEA